MTALSALLTAVAGSAALIGVLIAVLRARLHRVLWQLCVLEYRARFWERMCWIALAAGVALCATIALSLARGGDATLVITAVMRFELLGAAAGLIIIAAVVVQQTLRFNREGPPACASFEAPADLSSLQRVTTSIEETRR